MIGLFTFTSCENTSVNNIEPELNLSKMIDEGNIPFDNYIFEITPIETPIQILCLRFGRASRNCRGFGICQIGILTDCNGRQVPILKDQNNIPFFELELNESVTNPESLVIESVTLVEGTDYSIPKKIINFDESIGEYGGYLVTLD